MQGEEGRGKRREGERERREADCRRKEMFHNLLPLTSLFSYFFEQRTLHFHFVLGPNQRLGT